MIHYTMFLLGAVVRIDTIKYPKLIMIINRLIIAIYLITKWI